MSRHAQNVAPPFAGFPQSRQNQISVVVVTVQKKAVISIHPVFPRQKPDILRFDYQNLAAVGAFESGYFRIGNAQAVPESLGGIFFGRFLGRIWLRLFLILRV